MLSVLFAGNQGVNMGPLSDGINMDDIISKITAQTIYALQKVAKESVEEIKDNISIPYPPASKAGEYPRRRPAHKDETPNLIDGISGTAGDSSITMESSAPYSEALEFSTYKLPARPFFYKTINKIHDRVKKELEL